MLNPQRFKLAQQAQDFLFKSHGIRAEQPLAEHARMDMKILPFGEACPYRLGQETPFLSPQYRHPRPDNSQTRLHRQVHPVMDMRRAEHIFFRSRLQPFYGNALEMHPPHPPALPQERDSQEGGV